MSSSDANNECEVLMTPLLSERLGEIINIMDEKEMRWLELDEKQQ